MSDLISRSALLEKLVKRFWHIDRGRSWKNEYMPIHDAIRLDEIEILQNITITIEPVDAVPVVHARWVSIPIPSRYGGCVVECSKCYNRGNRNFSFCPSCGAKMDGGAEA